MLLGMALADFLLLFGTEAPQLIHLFYYWQRIFYKYLDVC